MRLRQPDKGTILCVDDEPSVLSAIRRALKRRPYKVLLAEGGQQALDTMAQTRVHVIVSDMRMPGMDGPTLLKNVKELYPDTIRMVLTGHADVSTTMDAINSGEVFRFVTKPWTKEDLLSSLEQALAAYRLNEENVRLMALTAKQNEELRKLTDDLQHQVVEVETLRLRLGAVLDQMADALIVIDSAGHCVVINPVARRMLGLDRRPVEPTDDVASLALSVRPGQLLETLRTSDDGFLRLKVERNGRQFDALVTPAKDAHSDGTGAVIVLREVAAASPLGSGTDPIPLLRDLEAPLAAVILSLRHLDDPSLGPLSDSQQAVLQTALRNCNRLDGLFAGLAGAAISEQASAFCSDQGQP